MLFDLVARGDIDPFDVSPRDGDGTVSGGGYRFPPEVIHQAIGPGALLSGEAWHLVLRQIGRIIGSRTTMPCPEQAGPDDKEMGRKVRANFIGSARTYGAHRVWRDVLAEGVFCGLHRIERLMQAQAFRPRGPPKCKHL